MQMLRTERQIQVRLSRFSSRKDNEGKKRWKVTLELSMDGNSSRDVGSPLLQAYKLMAEDADNDIITRDDKMESVRLEFSAIDGKEPEKVIPITELFDFKLSREKVTQAGTLKKEKSGSIILTFCFVADMMMLSGWIEEKYGNLLKVEVTKSQKELALEPEEAENDNSQAARNKRIVDEEKKDEAPAGAEAPKKRSHHKKKK